MRQTTGNPPPLMTDMSVDLLGLEARSNWVRLRTLINLRWLAVVGQSGAVLFVSFSLNLQLSIGLCFLAIGASVTFNVVSSIILPENHRLSERESLWTLLFDLSQLGVLLFLTGGLNNPFALLVLAPVTISATALRLQSTVFIAGFAILMMSVVAVVHIPLRLGDGSILQMPAIFTYGFWIALVIGVVFLGVYARRVTLESQAMSQALIATQMALSRQQKLTDLGGIIAATAHELGTPLATIKLASSELADDLADHPLLKEDAELIHQQADRCRDILRHMGQAGNEDLLLRHAPISAVVEEAAEPHMERGTAIHFSFQPKKHSTAKQPVIRRQAEIIHGLRNLIQNAVDFADGDVWVDIRWNDDLVQVIVTDNGPGYPQELFGRIGDPFVRKRRSTTDTRQRPAYEGMGLGLFIAKTLLQRSGAELTFTNGTDPFLHHIERPKRGGAIVEVSWRRDIIEQDKDELYQPLGRNTPLNI